MFNLNDLPAHHKFIFWVLITVNSFFGLALSWAAKRFFKDIDRNHETIQSKLQELQIKHGESSASENASIQKVFTELNGVEKRLDMLMDMFQNIHESTTVALVEIGKAQDTVKGLHFRIDDLQNRASATEREIAMIKLFGSKTHKNQGQE